MAGVNVEGVVRRTLTEIPPTLTPCSIASLRRQQSRSEYIGDEDILNWDRVFISKKAN